MSVLHKLCVATIAAALASSPLAQVNFMSGVREDAAGRRAAQQRELERMRERIDERYAEYTQARATASAVREAREFRSHSFTDRK
jgi:hypothetical protein